MSMAITLTRQHEVCSIIEREQGIERHQGQRIHPSLSTALDTSLSDPDPQVRWGCLR